MADDATVIIKRVFEQLLQDQDEGKVRPVAEYCSHLPDELKPLVSEYVSGVTLRPSDSSLALHRAREVGDWLGTYRLIEPLGRGGQGIVYLAEDSRLQRRVALKVLTAVGGPGSEQLVTRFQREAAVASKLHHPGICAVHDAGVVDGIPYIAMQYVEGETLAERIVTALEGSILHEEQFQIDLDSEGSSDSESSSTTVTRADVTTMIQIAEKAARALHVAHEAGIVHRDIKPGNIMVEGSSGDPVILDFGLARADEGEFQTLTRTGDVFGTPAYMSPEQVLGEGRRIDRRSDIYSLGATIYECLTLRRPIEAATREALYKAILVEDAPGARRLNPAVTRDLEVVLATALEKEPNRRYQTALDLAEDLRRVRMLEPVAAKPVGPLGRAVRWTKRRPYQAALLVALFLLVAAGGYLLASLDELRDSREKALLRDLELTLEAGYDALGNRDRALALTSFDAALELQPESPEAVCGQALTYLVSDEHQAVLALLDEHREVVGALPALRRVRVQALRALGRVEEASRLEADLSEPTSALGFFIVGQSLSGAGQVVPLSEAERAVRYLKSAIYRSRDARLLYYGALAQAARKAKDDETALALGDSVVALWPDSSRAWFYRGYATPPLDDPARHARIIDSYRESIRLDPHYHWSHNNLGSALRSAGRFEEATDAFREAVRLQPENDVAWNNLGLTLRDQGAYQEAIAAFRRSLALEPDRFAVRFNLGEALRHESSARELPESMAEEANREFERCLAILRRITAQDPENYRARDWMGFVLRTLGRPADALEPLGRALEINPEWYDSHKNLGLALETLGRHEEAIAAFTEAIRVRPLYHRAQKNLGDALAAAGNEEEALAAYRRAAELRPDYALAHTNIVTLLTASRDFEELRIELERWTEHHPGDGAAWHELAWALLRMGRREEYRDADAALAAARQAVTLGGESDPARLHTLALALQQADEVDEALEVGSRALAALQDLEARDEARDLDPTLRGSIESFLRRIRDA